MEYKTALFCEIDKYAAASYCGIHLIDPALNIGDITQADETAVPNFNVMFGGSPCQDFSVAGKQKGAVWTCRSCGHIYNPLEAHYDTRDRCPTCGSTEIEKTRSSLLVEWLRFLREKKPRFAIYENVKNIVSAKFIDIFNIFVAECKEYGYNVYWKVLNAKDYGIPQSRGRLYCVMIRADLDNGEYRFPNPVQLKHTAHDLLDDVVDPKYFLSDDKVSKMLLTMKSADFISKNCQRCATLSDKAEHFDKYSDIITALLARDYKGFGYKPMAGVIKSNSEKIFARKLTPKECWRFMGFDDQDYITARSFLNNAMYSGKDRSGSQLYKQAGNSIVVTVLQHIMKNLHNVMPYLFEDMVIGSFFSGIGAFEKALSRLGNESNEDDIAQPQHENIGLRQIGYIRLQHGESFNF